jgi:hypothetical protein
MHTCYHALRSAAADALAALARARTILDQAHTALLERAAAIDDPDLRRKFLENVPVHREIASAWEAYQHARREG